MNRNGNRKYLCPRCDQPFPAWQPVHLTCFFIRLVQVTWRPVVFLALMIVVVVMAGR
jgi:hypothetical protein